MNDVTGKYIQTPLGDITVRIKGMDPGAFWIKLVELKLNCEPNFQVDGCVAAVILIRPSRMYDEVRCECVFETQPVAPTPDSSEHLDAQKWDTNDHRVEVGTEDEMSLYRRLPQFKWSCVAHPVDYADNGLIINLPPVEKGNIVSFHFVVAWISQARLEEKLDCPGGPTWWAVDQLHDHLLKFAQADDEGVLKPKSDVRA